MRRGSASVAARAAARGLSRGLARGWGAACFLVLPTLLLGSCMVQGQSVIAPRGAGFAASAPTLEQARVDFYAVVDATVELVGGDWVNQDSATSRGCVVSFGLAGRTYTALRLATSTVAEASVPDTTVPDTTVPEIASPSATLTPLSTSEILRGVTSSWTGLGYTVERTRVGPAIQLLATSAAHEQLIFRISDRAMTLQGESECRPES